MLTVPQFAVLVGDVTWIGPMSPPCARLANEQLRTCGEPLIEHPENAGLNDQFKAPPLGSVSDTVMPVAVPGPLLCTVMSNPIELPAATGPAGFAVFVILITGHWTVTDAVDWLVESFSAAALAVLEIDVQSAFVVEDVTWIGPMSAPSARLANEQLNTWLPTDPLIEQPENAGLSDQFRSAPAGRLSLTVTPVNAPGPLLCTVMSNPMESPAVTGPAGLAVFVILIVGH